MFKTAALSKKEKMKAECTGESLGLMPIMTDYDIL